MEKKADIIYKIVLIGDSGTGKSSILRRICGEPFDPNFVATIGVEFQSVTRMVGGLKVTVQIWDTAGQERFAGIVKAYFRQSMGFILVFDASDEKSLQRLSHWISEFDSVNINTGRSIRMLVANKIDSPARFDYSAKVKEFCSEFNLSFMETSAKDGTNVEELIIKMIHKLSKVHTITIDKKLFSEEENASIALDGPVSKKSSCC